MAMYSRRSRPRHRTGRRPHEYLTNPDLPTYRVPVPDFQGLPPPDFPSFLHIPGHSSLPPPPFPIYHNYTHSPSHSPSPPYLDRRNLSDEDTIVLVIQREANHQDDDHLQEFELFYPYGTIFDGKITVGGLRREVERQLRDEGERGVVEFYFRNRLLDDDSRLLVDIGLESGDEIFVKVLDPMNVSLQREAEIERRRLERERHDSREAEKERIRMDEQREFDRLERERVRMEDQKEFERLERERMMEQREYQRRMEGGMRPIHTPPEDEIPRRHRADGAFPSSYQEESRMRDAGHDRFSSSYQEESRMRDAARERQREREHRMRQHEAECQAEAHRIEQERERRIRELREARIREHEAAAEAARRGRQSRRPSREREEHRLQPEEEAAAEEYQKHFHMPPSNSQQGGYSSSFGSSPDLDGTSSETSYNQSTTSRRSRYSRRSHSKQPPSTRAEPPPPPPPPRPVDDTWSTLEPPTLFVPPKFQTTEETIRTFRASNKANIFPVIEKFVDSTLNNSMGHRAELRKNPQWIKFHHMLSDIVSSLMCKLDDLDIGGDEELRSKRREVITEMEERGRRLDALVKDE